MHINMSDPAGKEKNMRNHEKITVKSNSELEIRSGCASSLQKLLEASKDAEALIACVFELYSVNADPLLEIWDRLARAIDEAQRHIDHPSTLSARLN
jgi:hypothetical protein